MIAEVFLALSPWLLAVACLLWACCERAERLAEQRLGQRWRELYFELSANLDEAHPDSPAWRR